jgi:hypothetical protein
MRVKIIWKGKRLVFSLQQFSLETSPIDYLEVFHYVNVFYNQHNTTRIYRQKQRHSSVSYTVLFKRRHIHMYKTNLHDTYMVISVV